jgi:hypothetical protein
MTPIPELDKKIEHFQNINAGIVSTIVTTLLTLSVGLIAYAVNIVVNATGPLACVPKWWMIASLALLLGSALIAIAIMFIRLEDYRRTIQGTALAKQFQRQAISEDEATTSMKNLKEQGDQLNRATNILLYVLAALFLVGCGCLAVSVFITNGSKLG